MKKLISVLFVVFLLAGCSITNIGQSNFEKVYALKGETVVVTASANSTLRDFANKVADMMVSSLGGTYGVNAIAFHETDEVTLSESPLADFAKQNHAKYILVKTFTKIGLYGNAIDTFDEELALLSLAERKVVWKATIKYEAYNRIGKGHAATGSVNKTMELLQKDGFVLGGM
jgi:hypothetical protein